jgi:hypothetical protein
MQGEKEAMTGAAVMNFLGIRSNSGRANRQ